MRLLRRRPTDGDFEAPRPAVGDARLTRVLAEREEYREAADLAAQDLRDARAERDQAKAGLIQAHYELERARTERDFAQNACTTAREELAVCERLREAAQAALLRTRDDLVEARRDRDLTAAQADALRVALPADGDTRLRKEVLLLRTVRAQQDRRLAELASLGCPRPCCTGRPTP